MLGVCLLLAAAALGEEPRFVPLQRFTLAWTHSIEKVRWEEDYAVDSGVNCDVGCKVGCEPGCELQADGTPPRLRALAARVRGSGAGMEPPPDAVWHGGWYHYRPAESEAGTLRLTRSEFTPDYELCADGVCRPLAHWVPSDGGVTLLSACGGAGAR
ncbi:MAG TPA: DUF1850 domain-containing protein [Rubrivivax sp.]|nr:DUF1850 domain-containing protein [Rubrivivax sp.]